jgi:probable dihydroxyacetone kinase regulator
MTKLALSQSLRQLMGEKPLDKITVKEIVEKCGVNRQTFYYHFKDIYDLLDWMFTHDGEEFARKYPQIHMDDDGQNAIRVICRSLKDNREMTIHIYHSLGRERLDRYLCREVHKLLYQLLKVKAGKLGATDADCDFLANFYKHAFVGITLDWVQEGMQGEIDEIVATFQPILRGTFDSALRRMAISH